MTSSELYHVYTELSELMKEHHLKDALPKIEKIRSFINRLYHEVKEEELSVLEEIECPSEEDSVHTSDEEFVAAEDSIELATSAESESNSDSDSECESGCNCEACKTC